MILLTILGSREWQKTNGVINIPTEPAGAPTGLAGMVATSNSPAASSAVLMGRFLTTTVRGCKVKTPQRDTADRAAPGRAREVGPLLFALLAVVFPFRGMPAVLWRAPEAELVVPLLPWLSTGATSGTSVGGVSQSALACRTSLAAFILCSWAAF